MHIGASSVSMLMTDLSSGSPQPMEFLEQPLPCARDIFSTGKVKQSTTERAVEILLGYLDSLNELGAGPKQLTRVVATNILNEAANRDVVMNRLTIGTGLPIEILDDGEMTRLVYMKTQRRLQEIPALQKKQTLVVHVGPGNTRALLFNKGKILFYASYRLGTHRTAEAIDGSLAEGEAELRLIRENASGPISRIIHDLRGHQVDELVLIGYEIQLMAPFLLKSGKRSFSLRTLKSLCREAAEMPEDQRPVSYQIDFNAAEALLPALEINAAIAEELGLKAANLATSDYERGLLYDLPATAQLTRDFEAEVIRSAQALADKFQTHTVHGKQVAYLAGRLFEETRSLHKLNEKDALLLQVAAILHECGGFVSPHMHHKHSQYLILHSEVFGLSLSERTVVALVARYHRMSPPKPLHEPYANLGHDVQIRVNKLAAILRVADALERTHSARVRDLSAQIGRNKLRLKLEGISDATAERLALQGKADLFQDIFGLEVVIQE
ncbi:MAG: HD domain-containing protein [Verrucomicrobiota bacterium JB023]|nr:HD domain-containing protein [Verrucomicrobiota bacterium JB023]